MANILITGGAGFIGSHLCERLLKDKNVRKVICVDNLDRAYPLVFKKENIALLLADKRFVFYKTDIRNKIAMAKIFKKERPDYVVNVAAKTDTRSSLNEPDEYASVNILGVLNMLELAKDFKCKKVVLISSSSVYGNAAAPLPFKESVCTDLPLSPYGATKKAGEVLAYGYSYNYGLPIACLRFFNVYGERMRPGVVISRWVENILSGVPIEMSGAGTRKRDFTYVGDAVDAIIKALKKGSNYAVFNVSASHPTSLTELLKVIERSVGVRAVVKHRPENKASINVSYGDITKARRILGWKPKVSLGLGIERYVSWFRKNRYESAHNHTKSK